LSQIPSTEIFLMLIVSFFLCAAAIDGFSFSPPCPHSRTRLAALKNEHAEPSTPAASLPRRQFLATALIGVVSTCTVPQIAQARYVLDDETGDFVQVEEEDWQTSWRQRLDKAQTMSTDEVFKAARGAGNVDLKQGPESDASKKRRAMSACRDVDLRTKANAGNERECAARVFAGEVDFMVDQL
jgi:hypothetical protein